LTGPIVLADFHHGALYHSMHMLFEERLGGTLYRPIGYGWNEAGLWQGPPLAVDQYLGIPDGIAELIEDGLYRYPSSEGGGFNHNCITLEKFYQTDFDFIIASIRQHEVVYRMLADQKNAAFIRQLGNNFDLFDPDVCKNILNSTTLAIGGETNNVTYHPEFNQDENRYTDPQNHNVIKNFMNCLPDGPDAHLWDEFSAALPEFDWKMHGILGRDGILSAEDVPRVMRESSFVYHVKFCGDGYGFSIHQAPACGRPLITRISDYKGLMAEPLLTDNETCIDINGLDAQGVAERIRHFAEPDRHLEMCENARRRFEEVVNFDAEFEQIKEFLKIAEERK